MSRSVTDATILGGPSLTYTQLYGALFIKRPMMDSDEAEAIASAYMALGELSGIGNLIPLAQAIHETGWFTSARWMQSRNPAGLGATNDGAWGAQFKNAAEGVTAQYAHLLAYAAKDADLSVPQRLLVQFDPRLEPVERRGWRGIAPRWIDLNGRWAYPGTTYGQKILEIARAIEFNTAG